jgi:hypothetical protein
VRLFGNLQPGKSYELEVHALAEAAPSSNLSGTAAAGYQINFSLAPTLVPEPGSLASIGLGLAILAWIGRPRR